MMQMHWISSVGSDKLKKRRDELLVGDGGTRNLIFAAEISKPMF